MHNNHFDLLIIGSGAAGLGLALALADDFQIAVLCKDDLLSSSSQYAQGGIAAVMDAKDSNTSHINDTLKAGDGLCHPDVVKHTVTQAKTAVNWLQQHGVQFNMQGRQYHLTQEGGHSHRRILHHQDSTGAAIVKTLSQQVLEHPNIQCLVEHTAIKFIMHQSRCCGAYFIDNRQKKTVTITANFTVLATGGASMAYLHTTNPNHTTGDGIVMAANAGARIANMEFQQFHPTCFYHPQGKTFLITEVMRGEGAKLVLENGESFMSHYDKRAELAPRDIVARAIHHQMTTKRLSHVYLDIRHQNADKIRKLFPMINQLCQQQGIDITQSLIPVVPAAHYTCGGVITNLDGETDIPGLFAIGEVACTGLHGANRMASNSLLECIVFAKNAAQKIKKQIAQFNMPQKFTDFSYIDDNNDQKLESMAFSLRRCLWENVGIVRSNQSLAQAKKQIDELEQQFKKITLPNYINKTIVELSNLIVIAQLIVKSAISRKESRGVHYNKDFPEKSSHAKDTITITDNNIKASGNQTPPIT